MRSALRFPPRARAVVTAALLLALPLAACAPPARAPAPPRDPVLRALPVFLYPAEGASPRAVVFFFGNDVGFWRAHQELAERLARDGYAVAGFDVHLWMAGLPDGSWRTRDSAFAAGIRPVMTHAAAELAPPGTPVVVAGHSIGAEIALWTAAHAPPAGMVGVLAMSPGARGHLRISLSDLANREPSDSGTFDVPAQLTALPGGVRVALVRGQRDKYRYADSAYAANGGERYRHYLVPLTGHSMKSLLVAGPMIDAALGWVMEGELAHRPPCDALSPPRGART